jgi:Tfp pilus assembly protein PilO
MKIDITSTYEREIENKPMNNVKFYVTLAFVLISTTFLFGIRPASKTLTQNLKYLEELTNIKESMKTRITKTNEGQIIILDRNDAIQKLNHAIPSKTELDDLLQEFVLTTSSTGFIVIRMRQVEEATGEIPITVEMSGELAKLPELVNAIESMNRFIQIKEIGTDEENGRVLFRMQIIAYTI